MMPDRECDEAADVRLPRQATLANRRKVRSDAKPACVAPDRRVEDLRERAIAGEVDSRRRRFALQQGATLLPRQANQVLPQQIEGDSEQDDILHQERDIACHRRKASR